MENGDHVGPALTAVAPDDEVALRALFTEQRARLAVVRQQRLWDWIGGMPAFGFAAPKAMLHGLYLQLGAVVSFAIALIVAGFTHGPVLWVFLGLVVASLVLRSVLVGRPMRRTRRLYERAVQAPAMVVAISPCGDPSFEGVFHATALVAFGETNGERLRALATAAERLGRMADGSEAVPDELAALVATVRGAMSAPVADGRRFEVPPSVAPGRTELAHVLVPESALPHGRITSRLLFVLCDPDSRAPQHTRALHSPMWGNGVERLCEAFPLEVSA